MKMIRKIGFIVLAVVILFNITGCGKDDNVEGTLEEIMEKVYKYLPDEDRPMMLTNIPLDNENAENYLGTNDIEFEEALASESAVGSIAHSVVLVRVKDVKDVESVKKTIKENVNPRKWICVGVEDDEVIIKNKGNLIILIIAENHRDKLEKGFDNL